MENEKKMYEYVDYSKMSMCLTEKISNKFEYHMAK